MAVDDSVLNRLRSICLALPETTEMEFRGTIGETMSIEGHTTSQRELLAHSVAPRR